MTGYRSDDAAVERDYIEKHSANTAGSVRAKQERHAVDRLYQRIQPLKRSFAVLKTYLLDLPIALLTHFHTAEIGRICVEFELQRRRQHRVRAGHIASANSSQCSNTVAAMPTTPTAVRCVDFNVRAAGP